ncbi:hypothetical protein FRB90_006020, partial [Tulasnella sp. 427]
MSANQASSSKAPLSFTEFLQEEPLEQVLSFNITLPPEFAWIMLEMTATAESDSQTLVPSTNVSYEAFLNDMFKGRGLVQGPGLRPYLKGESFSVPSSSSHALSNTLFSRPDTDTAKPQFVHSMLFTSSDPLLRVEDNEKRRERQDDLHDGPTRMMANNNDAKKKEGLGLLNNAYDQHGDLGSLEDGSAVRAEESIPTTQYDFFRDTQANSHPRRAPEAEAVYRLQPDIYNAIEYLKGAVEAIFSIASCERNLVVSMDPNQLLERFLFKSISNTVATTEVRSNTQDPTEPDQELRGIVDTHDLPLPSNQRSEKFAIPILAPPSHLVPELRGWSPGEGSGRVDPRLLRSKHPVMVPSSAQPFAELQVLEQLLATSQDPSILYSSPEIRDVSNTTATQQLENLGKKASESSARLFSSTIIVDSSYLGANEASSSAFGLLDGPQPGDQYHPAFSGLNSSNSSAQTGNQVSSGSQYVATTVSGLYQPSQPVAEPPGWALGGGMPSTTVHPNLLGVIPPTPQAFQGPPLYSQPNLAYGGSTASEWNFGPGDMHSFANLTPPSMVSSSSQPLNNQQAYSQLHGGPQTPLTANWGFGGGGLPNGSTVPPPGFCV